MNMKKIVLLAHDPGGYDVVFPVVQTLQREGNAADFYTAGPAAKLNPLHSIEAHELLKLIKCMLDNREIAGLVTGTSWGSNLELQAIAACRQVGVPTVSILDYWSNYYTRFVFTSGEVIYPDYYIVMDELAKGEAIQAGIPRPIITVLGHPGLDQYIVCPPPSLRGAAATRQFPQAGGLRNERKKVLFLSQPLSVLYGERLGYTEQQALAGCIKAAANRTDCRVHVKFHPKDTEQLQQRYAEIAVSGNLLAIMPEYDLIIGMSTMGLLHAVLMGIPAISYQPNLRQEDGCITNKLGLTKLAVSPPELERLMNAVLDGQVTVPGSELPQKLIWFDGRSTERVTGFILKVFGCPSVAWRSSLVSSRNRQMAKEEY